MNSLFYKLLAPLGALCAVFVVGCSEDPPASGNVGTESVAPGTREMVPVSMETVNLKVSGMT